MKLDLLHSGKLKYRPQRKQKGLGDLDVVDQAMWLQNIVGSMPGMHEVPHMSGTHGNVPNPGKPKWEQRPY